MMPRPTKDEWAMNMAMETAKMTTCLRRGVGCILLDHHGHVLSTGYNGVAAGLPHCDERNERIIKHGKVISCPHACPGSTSASGTNLDGCQAIHAEQNALLQCRDVNTIKTCVVTVSPCMTCTKLLLNTSCERILYLNEYTQIGTDELWKSSGRLWDQFEPSAA